MHPAIQRELGRRRMGNFVRYTMPDHLDGWHLRVLDRYLDRLAEGTIRRLMVFMPPRHGKSERVSRRLPAYFLGRNPDSEVMQISYAAELAARMNRDVQRIMDSPRYMALFPDSKLPMRGGSRSATLRQGPAKRTDSLFELAGRRGSLRSCGMLGGLTGMGFSLGVIDDPYKNAEEALSLTIRQKVEEEYRSSFLTRQAPDARILLTLTRWHHDDLAGTLLREDPGGWEVLSFPGVSKDVLGPADERSGPGQALWPERYGLDWLARMRRSIGEMWWSALYDQDPIPEGGMLFRRGWFGHYRDGGDYWHLSGRRDPIHKGQCTVFAAVDPAASEKESADHTAIVVGCLTETGDLLILEVIRKRLSPHEIPREMLDITRRHPIAFYAVEESGFQVAVIQAARQLAGMPPIRELMVAGRGKVVRATPAIIKAEAGQVFVPAHRGSADAPEWLYPFFDELERFRGEDEANDQVDAFAWLVRQCPRMLAEKSNPDQDEVMERLSLKDRESAASRRHLYGR